MWHTLGVTAGFKQPAKPFEDCFCTACATANARGKGLKHTQYSNAINMAWQRKPDIGLTGYDVPMVGNSTCPSSVAFGQDIADLGVTSHTQQAMVNSLEYATLEGQARSKYDADINAALTASVACEARDNAGCEPYAMDGYESSSTTSSDSLNQVWCRCATRRHCRCSPAPCLRHQCLLAFQQAAR